MARTSLREIRKREIIDAAIDVIGEVGLSDATLSLIGKRAGLSAPLMVHYFEDKSLIIEASMRRLSAILSREVTKRLSDNSSYVERLDAIIEGCFSLENFAPGTMEAWLEFWLHIPRTENLQRLHKVIAARFWSNIRFAFKGLLPGQDVEDGVQGLSALIDGFWWRYAIDPASVNLDQAKRICRSFAESYIAGGAGNGPVTKSQTRQRRGRR